MTNSTSGKSSVSSTANVFFYKCSGHKITKEMREKVTDIITLYLHGIWGKNTEEKICLHVWRHRCLGLWAPLSSAPSQPAGITRANSGNGDKLVYLCFAWLEIRHLPSGYRGFPIGGEDKDLFMVLACPIGWNEKDASMSMWMKRAVLSPSLTGGGKLTIWGFCRSECWHLGWSNCG